MTVRILILNSDVDGVGYFRMFSPHLTIHEQDPDIKTEIRLMSDGTIPLMDDNFLRQYNMIYYNKVIPFTNPQIEQQFRDKCKALGIKIVYDIDDYFILDSTHLNYQAWKDNKSQEKIEELIKSADAVTTTTPLFAETLRKYNPNVYVLPNATNFKEQQWSKPKPESSKVRFLWGGGISHKVDLMMLKPSFKEFEKDFLDKAQLYLCGFDLRVKMPNGAILKDDPNRSQWGLFESIFNNDKKWVKNIEYLKFLNEYDNTNYGYREEFKDEFYQRRWTKDICSFGNMYSDSDVTLAPLKNNHPFNYHKSQLKLIESGTYKSPIILSQYGPYTVDDIEGKHDGKRKGFYVEESKNDWYQKMKWFVDNPSAVEEYGNNLHEYVKENYSMEKVNKLRADVYKEILSK